MTETTHTRSRRASLGGLLLQLAAFGGILILGTMCRSVAVLHLAWYLLGGLPLWFVALLVFRQRELAALEALDLEELRREKQAIGAGEALFDEAGGGGLGYRVAELRLQWMLRWFVPAFGLVTAVYLAGMGLLQWRNLSVRELALGAGPWPELVRVPMALVILALAMLATFWFSRYASGMGRVREWQLLRGCGSYLLGNALVTMAILIGLGIQQYAAISLWDHLLAYAIPCLMVVLAVETAANFVLDIYRPRAAGVEPRACFDSRLLGLLAEPGGIASSIADAINYQFGFQVSQTWFYQLLQRAFVPLAGTGALALWLLTCLVLVQPYEHVIIARFGRQLNADQPLEPGLHTKLPWPIDAARAYNTGQLHQVSVGFQDVRAVPDPNKALGTVQLWTDEQHMGLPHFDFLICPVVRGLGPGAESTTEPADTVDAAATEAKESPVHLVRMEVVVQYRIQPDRLAAYTQSMVDPDGELLNIAWEEISRFSTSATIDGLLSEGNERIGAELRLRMADRVRDIGLDVVYVGVTNIHPEKTVAEAFRNVVKAEQEKIAAIREALVTENERLSKVSGDAQTARSLALAVEQTRRASEVCNDTLDLLTSVAPALLTELNQHLEPLELVLRNHVEAQARLDASRERLREIAQDYELGFGQTAEQRVSAFRAVAEAEDAEQATAVKLEAALAPVRMQAAARLAPAQVDALLRGAAARIALRYWEDRLARGFTTARLEGEAAAKLAGALAERWTIELTSARELVQAENEREAYRAAPQIYKARRLMDVLVEGLKDARKYFLAFDPGDRRVHVRFIAEDEPRLQPTDISPDRKNLVP